MSLDVVRRVAGDGQQRRQRRRLDAGDGQVVVEAAVDLQLRDRADADADADRRRRRARLPSRPDTGYCCRARSPRRLRSARARRRSVRDLRSTSGRCCAAANAGTARRAMNADRTRSRPRRDIRIRRARDAGAAVRTIEGPPRDGRAEIGRRVEPRVEQMPRRDVGQRLEHRLLDPGMLALRDPSAAA